MTFTGYTRGGKRLNSQKCILCVSPKNKGAYHGGICQRQLGSFYGRPRFVDGDWRSNRVTIADSGGECVDASFMDVQLMSRGKATVKSGNIDWRDKRDGLSTVRSIFNTSGQKPHDCGCNIDDVSSDNEVNVHPGSPPLSRSLRGRENPLVSITIIGPHHTRVDTAFVNEYFRANVCWPA